MTTKILSGAMALKVSLSVALSNLLEVQGMMYDQLAVIRALNDDGQRFIDPLAKLVSVANVGRERIHDSSISLVKLIEELQSLYKLVGKADVLGQFITETTDNYSKLNARINEIINLYAESKETVIELEDALRILINKINKSPSIVVENKDQAEFVFVETNSQVALPDSPTPDLLLQLKQTGYAEHAMSQYYQDNIGDAPV